MAKNYRITYSFQLNKEKNNIKKLSLDYWTKRKFNCNSDSDKIIGKRGSVLGNLTSFDMTKLKCKLHVKFIDAKHICAELIVLGKFQDITEINLSDFKLELILFHRTVNELSLPNFMSEYNTHKRNSASAWLCNNSKGRDLTSELKEKLEDLTKGEALPVVEVK